MPSPRLAAIPEALVGSIPSPSNGVLHIGPLDLRAYGLMIALGVVAAVWLAGRRFEELGIGTRDDASAVALWGVPAGVIGARLYHVATDWERFSDHPVDILKIWKGGLGIPGGMALGIVVGLWAAWRRGLPVGGTLDGVAPALPLAQAIGRWGNWFNQELYGRPTKLPWALEIDDAHLPSDGRYPSGTTFHPTFLYESLWNLGLCGLLIWIGRRFRLRPGRLVAIYVLGYGVGRLWVESLRIDPAKEGGGLRLNEWMALLLIVGSLAYLAIDAIRHHGLFEPAPAGGGPDPDALDSEALDSDAPGLDDSDSGDPGVGDSDPGDPGVGDPDPEVAELDDSGLEVADLEDADASGRRAGGRGVARDPEGVAPTDSGGVGLEVAGRGVAPDPEGVAPTDPGGVGLEVAGRGVAPDPEGVAPTDLGADDLDPDPDDLDPGVDGTGWGADGDPAAADADESAGADSRLPD